MIVGALLGFFGSILPEALKVFQDRQDKKHELAILEMQMKQQTQGHIHKLEEIYTQADIKRQTAVYQHDASLKSGYKWVDALRASVRPVLAYSFFGLYATIKLLTVLTFYNNGVELAGILDLIWTAVDAEIFASVVAFYFSSRAIQRYRQDGA